MAASRELLPCFLAPMLLRPGLPPAGEREQWALELKWDDMRAQLRLAREGGWCLRSRPGRNCSDQFPELASLAAAVPTRDVLLDGELVCLDADGRLTSPPCAAASPPATRARPIASPPPTPRH